MPQHTGLLNSASINDSISQKSILYLTKVSYNEPKHEVLVEFSNAKERLVERYRFFPFLLLSSSIEKEKLEGLLLSAGFKGFSI